MLMDWCQDRRKHKLKVKMLINEEVTFNVNHASTKYHSNTMQYTYLENLFLKNGTVAHIQLGETFRREIEKKLPDLVLSKAGTN